MVISIRELQKMDGDQPIQQTPARKKFRFPWQKPEASTPLPAEQPDGVLKFVRFLKD